MIESGSRAVLGPKEVGVKLAKREKDILLLLTEYPVFKYPG